MSLVSKWVAGAGRRLGLVDLAADVTGKLPAINGGVPPGTGMDFWGASLPTGYLWAAGQSVSRTTYADLFAALGTTHGGGDGSTTFNLPDKRGRVSVGRDTLGGSPASRVTTAGSGINGSLVGASGGAETHTLVTAEMPAHTHNITGALIAASGSARRQLGSTGSDWPSAATGGDGPHNNVQPSIVCNYIIKY